MVSEVLLCLPAVRFDMFPPNCDSRYSSAPKPGKEKQKCYDCRCAFLMVHLCILPLCVYPGTAKQLAQGYGKSATDLDTP
jgi:hypothetical protein